MGLPNRTFLVRGQKFASGKKSKQRISVLVCANSDGTEKLKLLVIGKAKQPRSFRGKSKLSVVYRFNSRSWMTSELFGEFLKDFNKKMKIENRFVALIIDQCPSHKQIPLSNVKIIFLPPNSTSRLQPMDLGIIHTIKARYRQKLVKRMLAFHENKVTFDKNFINIYDSISMLTEVWKELESKVIENCFRKCGINSDNEMDSIEEITDLHNNKEWDECSSEFNAEKISFENYVSSDDNILTFDSYSEQNITKESEEISFRSDSDDNGAEEEDKEIPIKISDALICASTLRRYGFQTDCSQEFFDLISNLEKQIYENRSKRLNQSKITDFFN